LTRLRVCRAATVVVRSARFLAQAAAFVALFATPVRGLCWPRAGVLLRRFTRA
jgi:hypothetical protein